MSDQVFPEPKDLGQAILLLTMMSRQLSGVHDDLQSLRNEMATRRELHEVRDELSREIESIRAEVRSSSATSTLKRFSEIAQQLAIIVAVIGGTIGGAIAVVHFWDKLPK